MSTLPALLRGVPAAFWDVPWDGSRFPGAVPRGQLALGADSNLFAYEVLAQLGKRIPDLRSEELWRDTAFTQVVLTPQPLDLVLFHDREQAFGAHCGLVCSDTEVVHLCKEAGRPVVWTFQQFAETARYAHLVGYKRPL